MAAAEGQQKISDKRNASLEDEDEDDEEESINGGRYYGSSASGNYYRPLLRSESDGSSGPAGAAAKKGSKSKRAKRATQPTLLTQTLFDARYRFTRPKSSRSLRQYLCLLQDAVPSRRCLVDSVLGFFPFIGIMREYQWRSDLMSDTIAGLTVGIMNIPQGMAYAILADLPPVCGLYLGFFPLILYFFFGTSRQVSMGTFALSSLMVAVPVTRIVGAQLSPALIDLLGAPASGGGPANSSSQPLAPIIAHGNYSEETLNYYRIEVALSVTLLAGFIQFALGMFRFGFITIYLSTPLVSGFTTGAAFHVMTSQVPSVFGITVPRHASSFKLIHSYVDIIERLADTNVASVIISIVSIGLLLLFRLVLNDRIAKRCRFPVPIELILVVVGTAVSHFAHLHSRCQVDIVGHIPSGLRAPKIPSIHLFHLVWQDALMLAVIMYVCTFSICKIYANKHGYLLDSNQELLASGILNSVGPIFGCYFSAGSLSRSQVQEDMRGRTQVASLIAAGLMIFVLLFLGPLFRELPTAVLGCIIIVALKGLFMQFGDAKKLFRISKYDFSIWIVCFLGVVILNVSYGLMLGFAYSLLTVVCRTQSPSTSILGRLPMTDIYKDVRFYPSAVQIPGVSVFRFDGALYFASVDNFRYRLIRLTAFDPKEHQLDLQLDPIADASPSHTGSRRLHHVVIECSGINYIDSVGASFLKSLIAEYQRTGVTILFACCKHQFRRMCERCEFADKCSLYVSVHDAVLSALAEFPDQRDRMASLSAEAALAAAAVADAESAAAASLSSPAQPAVTVCVRQATSALELNV